MKVKQVVGEHKKGFRAKKYAMKPKQYIAPIKPVAPTKPAELNEGIDELFHRWMNSEYAPMDDDSGDDRAVFDKAIHFAADVLNGRSDAESLAWRLTSKFHGEDDDLDETTPIGVVSSVSPDGKQVVIKKTDGTELKTTGDAVLPGPDGKTASLAPGAGNDLKPGTPITSNQEGATMGEGRSNRPNKAAAELTDMLRIAGLK
jgi:hypothetical protein